MTNSTARNIENTSVIEDITIMFGRTDDASTWQVYEAIAELYKTEIAKRFPDAFIEVCVDRNRDSMIYFNGEKLGFEDDVYKDFVANTLGHLGESSYMNKETGSVDTYEAWEADSKNWEGDIEEQLESLVEVVKINGSWVKCSV